MKRKLQQAKPTYLPSKTSKAPITTQLNSTSTSISSSKTQEILKILSFFSFFFSLIFFAHNHTLQFHSKDK